MRKATALLLLFVLLLNLGGCYDKQDIERRTSILAVGIDVNPEDEEGMEITIRMAVPHTMGANVGGGEGGGEKGGGGEPALAATTRGDSISSIFQKLENMANNPFFFGHTILLVISQEAAEGGIYTYLDYFLRNTQFRRKSWLVITPGKAKELLELTTPLHPLSTMYMITTLENNADLKSIPDIRFENFITSLNCPAEQPTAVMLETAGDKLQLSGLAAFTNDKMVGELDPAEVRLFLYLTQPKGRGLVHLLEPGSNRMEICYQIRNTNPHISLSIEDGKPSFTFRVWVEGNIVENYLGEVLDDEAMLRHLERRLAAKLENECRTVIQKIQQEIGTDILNLGELVRAYRPHYWKQVDWQEEFPRVPIAVQVTAHIRRLGLRRK